MKYIAINMDNKSVDELDNLIQLSRAYGFCLCTKKKYYLDVYKSNINVKKKYSRVLLSEDKKLYLEDPVFKETEIAKEISYSVYVELVSSCL